MVAGQTELHRAQTGLSDVTEVRLPFNITQFRLEGEAGRPHSSQAGAHPLCLAQVQDK